MLYLSGEDLHAGPETAPAHFHDCASFPSPFSRLRARIVKSSGVEMYSKVALAKRCKDQRLHSRSVVLGGTGKQREGLHAQAQRPHERNPLEADGGVAQSAAVCAVFKLRQQLDIVRQPKVRAQERACVGVLFRLSLNLDQSQAHLDRSLLGGLSVRGTVRRKGPSWRRGP